MTDAHGAVLVTGGSAGIGRAIVELLVERGFDVGFTYRTRERAAQAICERSSTRVEATRADFADPEAAVAAVHELAARFDGSVYALVNNAGINRRAMLGELDLAGLTEVLNVNLASPLLAARAATEYMPAGGRIVNVTSVLDREPLHGAAAYCASKAGLAMASRVLALELAERGITVNCVAPGHAATPMNFGDREVDAHSTTRSAIPIARPAAPREIAAAVAYFLSGEAAYTTGASLLVDGGLALKSGPVGLETSPEFLDNLAGAGR
jgi:NAD(P)-dependent dehydrogenase (short-subunit alcohol dehydrogenase family)